MEETAARGRLLVLRHAQSTWNAEGRWQGWSDAPLSPAGAAQALSAGRALADQGVVPGAIVSSDLLRAQRTAELLAQELGYEGPVLRDADLREQDLGEWNGLTNAEIAASWPAELEARRRGAIGPVPGGEEVARFVSRALAALRRTADLAVAGGADVIVVTHGGVVIALEKELGAWSPANRHSNLCGWWAEVREGPVGVELSALRPANLLVTGAGTVTGGE